MRKLKSISKESIPKALVRAKHYRLLNEPWQAASICRDILMVDDDHQKAILYLILSITDQFGHPKRSSEREARKLCKQLNSEYEQLYYQGIIAERLGKVALARPTPRAHYIAFEYYEKALDLFEKAQEKSPPHNQDATLRWNSCVRAIQEHNLKRAAHDDVPTFLE